MDREQVFDEDYLYFYSPWLTDERNDAETDLIWRLTELEAGMEVLDLACGHGRIANRLASRGVRVTGLDATPLFLELARADAAERGVEVDYVEGDMRELPWTERFDRVLLWFTTFGYFSDEENRLVLREVWLLGAGFESADAFDMYGEPLSLDGRRMITVARRAPVASRE